MFRDVQTEFVKKVDCIIRAVYEQGDSAWVKVEEKILVYKTIWYLTYDIHFDNSTHVVRRDCNLFESASILCCHCLVVLSSYKVNEVSSYYILLHWKKNIKRKHTYIKSSHDVRRSDESHNIFKGLCVHFYNIAQKFVDCDNEANILHAALDDVRTKLVDYHARMRNKIVTNAHNSIAIETSSVVGTEDIQGLSKEQRDNHVESSGNIDLDAPAQQIA
ncbi:hypothetical protein AHAS_Ahas04G0116800 [Arachis hypogaea]|uniref:Protein FAR1-RELATED SEQUENCE n=1 Tax=Arachis hypogaea TaxID=3818 RepID=A0A445DGP7_ARAHY|nr:hypothetical protein Ahy_A04g019846 [Arachis hypogaea]